MLVIDWNEATVRRVPLFSRVEEKLGVVFHAVKGKQEVVGGQEG